MWLNRLKHCQIVLERNSYPRVVQAKSKVAVAFRYAAGCTSNFQ